MDGLNSIDDDLTDFINQIANSNDSDSPPGSAQSSSDSNSVRQLELLETIETKAVLPPCQVCGGNSSGLHYGVYTCEACKVFFRRSWEKHKKYICRTGRMNCSPSDKCVYPCKLCRYLKCLKVGMSRDAIRHGPYTIVRKLKNRLLVAEIQKKKLASPNLLPYADADDFIVFGTSTFHEIRHLMWSNEIENFDLIFNEAVRVVENGLFDREVYMDVYETLGLAIDNRKVLSSFVETILKKVFSQLICFMMKLPGLSELEPVEFISNLIKNYDIFCMVMIALSQSYWENDIFNMKINNRIFPLTWGNIADMHGESFTQFLKVLAGKLYPLNLTLEEIFYIFTISLLSDKCKFPKLQSGYNRMLLSFTRYLESTYGKDYHTRIYNIVSYLGSLKEILFVTKKAQKDENYLMHLYESKFFVSLWFNDLSKQSTYAMVEIEQNCEGFAQLLSKKSKLYK